jgi:hypothetical protein
MRRSRSEVLRRALLAAIASSGLLRGEALARSPETADSLAAARSIFAEALHDEDAGRAADALHKFQRVRDVRDTASIEYRIATCDERLGDAPAAFVAYRKAIALGQGEPANVDVVRAAVDRLDALARLVGRLTVVFPENAPPAIEVRVDDVLVPRASLGEPIPLVPGPHTVVASGPGLVALRSQVVLTAGSQASIPLMGTERTTSPVGEGAAPRPPPGRRAVGLIVAGASVPVLVAAAAFLVGRELDVASLDRACPGGSCPPGADAAALQSTRDRALAEGPVAATLGVVGAAMAVTGVVLVLSTNGDRPQSGVLVGPEVASGAWGLRATVGF